MSRNHCQAEGHEGDRMIPYGDHSWEYRTTYRRDDGKERRHEKTRMHVCRACMERREQMVNEGLVSLDSLL